MDDARWLSAEVTRLRDLYLLWQDTLTPARVALPDNTALQSLEVRALERINSERAALRELLEGERVVEMMARGRDMSDPEFWRPAAGSQEKLEALCHETLEVRLNQALKHGETLKRLDSQARDSFRKSLRKLRATAEFTQVMFSSKKTKAFLKQLKKLLDSMVAARDASAVRDRLEDLMEDMDAASPEHHIANELIKAKEAWLSVLTTSGYRRCGVRRRRCRFIDRRCAQHVLPYGELPQNAAARVGRNRELLQQMK